MGYGRRALECLIDFFEGKFTSLDENPKYVDENMVRVSDAELESATLQTDNVKVRDPKTLPALLLRMTEKRPDPLDYLGVSYGLTPALHKFWKRAGFAPVYLRQTATELTGEHSCVMVRPTKGKDTSWLGAFARDFHKRFLQLLSYNFRDFSATLGLMLIESASMGARLNTAAFTPRLDKPQLDALLSPFDLKRLESYANDMLDYHVIIDMVPLIAHLYFTGALTDHITLSPVQQGILLAVGLQRKSIEDVGKELGLPNQQVLAMFIKVVRKIASHFRGLLSQSIAATLPAEDAPRRITQSGGGQEEGGTGAFQPLEQSLDQDLKEAGKEAMDAYREKQRELISSMDLSKFEIPGTGDWQEAEKLVEKKKSAKGAVTVSVRTGRSDKDNKKRKATAAEVYEQEIGALEEGQGQRGKKGRRGGR